MIALVCSRVLRTKVPINYALLGLLTFLETCAIGGFVSLFTPQAVLISIGVLALTVSSLFIVSLFLPKSAHLIVGFLVFGGLIAVVMNVLFWVILFKVNVLPDWVFVLYASLGVAISAIYVLLDLIYIQVMEFDDYILGALMLYLDIMRMFVYLLSLIGRR